MGKIYDNGSVSIFPKEFKMELPDGYRIDTEYDDDMNEVYHLRGGFYTNDEGNEDFSFTGSFITLNVDVTVNNDADPQTVENLRNPSHPDFAFNQAIEGLKGNLDEQYGPGKCIKLFNSHPCSAIMKYYQPFLVFGATLDTYLLFYWVDVDEHTKFGLTSVYQPGSNGSDDYYKHLLNVIKSVRVEGQSVDFGNLTPKKLEEALDIESNDDVEALDLGLKIGMNFQIGDEEMQYTFNNDGSITTERDGEIVDITDELGNEEDSNLNDNWGFGMFNSYAEPSVKISEDNERVIIVDNAWSFELPDGLEFKFDAAHRDILGNESSAQYLVEGLPYNGISLFDFELHEIFNIAGTASAEIDAIGCRYDNDVTSGNAQQTIIRDDDDLFVDIKGKPVFFSRSTVQIRVRGEDLRPWDFVSGVDSNDADLMERWDDVKALYRELAESIKLLDEDGKSKTKKGTNKDTQGDPDFIVQDGVLRKYIGSDCNVIIPDGIKEIADSTFAGFNNLKSVVIPDGVKRIGTRSFENCLNLERCELPNSIEIVGDYAFVDCHELQEINLNDSISYIGGSAFSECFKLKDVNVPKGIDMIDAFTFKNCNAFTHIDIPDGVKAIGFSAFASCDNLEYLFIPESVSDFSIDFMDNTPFAGSGKLKIYTPKGSAAEKFASENGIPYETSDADSVVKEKPVAVSGWGQNITVEGKDMGDVDTKETKDTGSGWGQGITVGGKKI